MTPEQAEKFRYNVLDLTKVWPHAEFPLRPFGKLVLNENPANYFAEIEQVRPRINLSIIGKIVVVGTHGPTTHARSPTIRRQSTNSAHITLFYAH